MSDFLDDLWFGIKKVTAVAGQKTTELAGMGKLKYQEQMLKRDIAKAYAKLGALVYESRVNGQDFEDDISVCVEDITTQNTELDNVMAGISVAMEDFKKTVEVERTEKPSNGVDVDIDINDISVEEPFETTADDIVEKMDNLDGEADELAVEVEDLAGEIIGNLHND